MTDEVNIFQLMVPNVHRSFLYQINYKIENIVQTHFISENFEKKNLLITPIHNSTLYTHTVWFLLTVKKRSKKKEEQREEKSFSVQCFTIREMITNIYGATFEGFDLYSENQTLDSDMSLIR